MKLCKKVYRYVAYNTKIGKIVSVSPQKSKHSDDKVEYEFIR